MAAMALLFALAGIADVVVSATAPQRGCDVHDDVHLVQREWHTQQRDLELDNLKAQQQAKFQAALEQLPFELPAGLSVHDGLFIAQATLQFLRNESAVAAMKEGIANITRDFPGFLAVVRNSTMALQRSSAQDLPEEQALEALEDFWRANEEAWAAFMAKVGASMLTISLRQPNEARVIEKALKPLFNSGALSSLGAMNFSFLGPISQTRANEIFLDKHSVCPKLKLLWPKLVSTEPVLLFKVMPAIADPESRKGFEGMVQAFAPDVSDRVIGIMDMSFKAALDMARGWQPLLHDGIDAVEVVAERGLTCKLPREVAVHGSGTCPSLGALAGLAAAIAAWWSLGP